VCRTQPRGRNAKSGVGNLNVGGEAHEGAGAGMGARAAPEAGAYAKVQVLRHAWDAKIFRCHLIERCTPGVRVLQTR